ncbi:MAG: hypothetical protein ACK561_06970 [Pseudomonadaceae bacterium]
MPGTFGSLLGLPLAWCLLVHPPRRQALIAVILLALAVPLCHWASLWLGGRGYSTDRCRRVPGISGLNDRARFNPPPLDVPDSVRTISLVRCPQITAAESS